MNLVDDWKKAKSWFSVQAMVGVQAFLTSWALLPQRFQDALPIGAVITIAIAVLAAGTVGRVIDQTPKDKLDVE